MTHGQRTDAVSELLRGFVPVLAELTDAMAAAVLDPLWQRVYRLEAALTPPDE